MQSPVILPEHKLLKADFLQPLAEELFPLMRSITGGGIEQSMQIFQRYIPLEITKIPSGTEVFDWQTPDEWVFESAKLWGPDGSLILDAADNNLHLLNYSIPFEGTLSLADLQTHLYSLPDQPDLIPYVTSYYTPRWGLCLSQQQRDALVEGDYKVEIKTSFKTADQGGGVPYADCLLKGSSNKEIVFTSYLCHPSMGNNELSGPLVLLGLYHYLSKQPNRRFSYRFVLHPETIGSLCYLHHKADQLKQNMVGGMILSCMGGADNHLSLQKSRKGDGLVDQLWDYLTAGKDKTPEPFFTRAFTPTHGSDERQYCAPGFNLPMSQLSRTVFGKFPYYHNSGDDLAYMDCKQIAKSIESLSQFLDLLELAGTFHNLKPYGEPQLGKRGLYPTLNSAQNWTISSDTQTDSRDILNRLLMILSYSDSQNNMMEIADMCGCPLSHLAPIIKKLEQADLLALEPSASPFTPSTKVDC